MKFVARQPGVPLVRAERDAEWRTGGERDEPDHDRNDGELRAGG